MIRLLPVLLLLSSCSPFVEYQHISDPRIEGDGIDLICAGGQWKKQNFETTLAACRDYWNTGTLAKVGVKYTWKN